MRRVRALKLWKAFVGVGKGRKHTKESDMYSGNVFLNVPLKANMLCITVDVVLHIEDPGGFRGNYIFPILRTVPTSGDFSI